MVFPRPRHPLKPFGMLANEGASTIDATMPMMSMLGDQMADAAEPAIKEVGKSVLSKLAPMAGQAVTALAPAFGGAAPAVAAGGQAMSALSPQMIDTMANAALPFTKAMGRAGAAALSRGLRGAGRFLGDESATPQTERANFARSMMASAPMMKPGPLGPMDGMRSGGSGIMIEGNPDDVRIMSAPPEGSPSAGLQDAIMDRMKRRLGRTPERM